MAEQNKKRNKHNESVLTKIKQGLTLDLEEYKKQQDMEDAPPAKDLGLLKKLFKPVWDRILGNNPENQVQVDSSKVSANRIDKSTRAAGKLNQSLTNQSHTLGSAFARTATILDRGFENDRLFKYVEYMNVEERFPEVSATLDIVADESIQRNVDGHILTVQCENEVVKEILEELLYSKLDIDNSAWKQIRNMVKYGDTFYEIVLEHDEGVTALKYRSPRKVMIVADILTDKILGYLYNDTMDEYGGGNGGRSGGGYGSYGSFYENFIASFKDNAVYYNSNQIVQFSLEDEDIKPYGKSYLERVRNIALQMSRLEDALTIYRLSRAPEKRIFFIDIGGLPTAKVKQHINSVINQFRNKKVVSPTSGSVVNKFDVESIIEDYFVPVRRDGGNTRIETLPGANNLSDIEDVLYFRRKFYAGLGISAAYLGNESEVTNRTTLVQQSRQFAKRVQRIQNDYIKGLYKVAFIELTYKKIDLENVDFRFIPTLGNFIEELGRLEVLTERLNIAQSMQGLDFSNYYIKSKILRMTDEEIIEDELRKRIEAGEIDAPSEEAALGGLGNVGGIETFTGPESGDLTPFEADLENEISGTEEESRPETSPGADEIKKELEVASISKSVRQHKRLTEELLKIYKNEEDNPKALKVSSYVYKNFKRKGIFSLEEEKDVKQENIKIFI